MLSALLVVIAASLSLTFACSGDRHPTDINEKIADKKRARPSTCSWRKETSATTRANRGLPTTRGNVSTTLPYTKAMVMCADRDLQRKVGNNTDLTLASLP